MLIILFLLQVKNKPYQRVENIHSFLSEVWLRSRRLEDDFHSWTLKKTWTSVAAIEGKKLEKGEPSTEETAKKSEIERIYNKTECRNPTKTEYRKWNKRKTSATGSGKIQCGSQSSEDLNADLDRFLPKKGLGPLNNKNKSISETVHCRTTGLNLKEKKHERIRQFLCVQKSPPLDTP
jgi:hypothetical protein